MSTRHHILARSVSRHRMADRVKVLELEQASLLRTFPELRPLSRVSIARAQQRPASGPFRQPRARR